MVVISATAACGRIGFDEFAVAAGTTDAHTVTSDGRTSVGSDAAHDSGTVASGNGVGTCANPIAIAYGQTLTSLSIAGATDNFDNGCGSGGADSVFQITLASGVAMASFQVSADFAGALGGIADVCPPPPPPSSCSPINPNSNGPTIGRPLTAGTHYIFVQKMSGAGVTFSIRSQ